MTKPVLYQKCEAVYNIMASKAEPHPEFETLVFIGHMKDVFEKANIPYHAYYSTIMQKLKQQNCIELVSRGGPKKYAVWLVHNPPEVSKFLLTTYNRRIKYEEIILDLVTRVERLEDQVYGRQTDIQDL